MPQPPLTLFYDGLCPLCSREIAYYRRRLSGADVSFLDITAPDFDAARHGLHPGRVRRVMHVKVGDEVRTGLDAFIAVWQRVPGHAWLARLASRPGVYHLMTGGYHLFALVRPLLPRRRRCEGGACAR
jgi:predicted DCC family thiol-disulfide oxidoreductase YuxK